MGTCAHSGPRVASACAHVLAGDTAYRVRFLGRGRAHELLCGDCATTARSLAAGDSSQAAVALCAACAETARGGGLDGIDGEPAIARAPDATARFVRVPARAAYTPRFVEAQPVLAAGADRARFIAIAESGALYDWDVDRETAVPLRARVPSDLGLDLGQPLVMRLSPDARLAAIANRRGIHGAIVELATGEVLQRLARDGYHAEHCDFSLAMLARGGRDVAIYASAWNRLDAIDARTGALLTARGPTSYQSGEERPEHYLDYFHCGLAVSPGDAYIADAGWVWHPIGGVATWSLARWLDDNPWESEDGPSKQSFAWRTYYWDGPMCWLDGHTLAIYGFGDDDEHLLPAARVFDARTGVERDWFPGPAGAFHACDGMLVSESEAGLALWDVATGALVAEDARPAEVRYHPGARVFAWLPGADGANAGTTRLVGRDAAQPWTAGVVGDLADQIVRDGSFEELPVLGDALERAGCEDAEILAHCQQPGDHGAARCWVIDRLRGVR